jgi:hypothetical protein
MKRISIVTLLFAATILPVMPRLHAQDAFMKVTVPFEFAVGNKMLPAGEYQISHEGGSLRIQNRNTKTGLYVIPNPGDASLDRQSRLRFEHMNGVYFLKNIVAASSANSSEFPTSRLQRQTEEKTHRTYAASFGR